MTPAPTPDARPVLIPVIAASSVTLVPLCRDGIRLADAIGMGRALALVSRFGGSHLDLSGDVEAGPVAAMIGADAARAVLSAIGPRNLDPDLDRFRASHGRRSRGLWLLTQGRSQMDVTLACDVTVRTVATWRQALARLPAHHLAQIHQEEPR